MFECESALNGLAAFEQVGLGRSTGDPYARPPARKWKSAAGAFPTTA
jgi:hypothetical protein